jgi:hypothetical protein
MRDFDFIEIGTSDFDTIVQGCPEDSVGLVIEPLGIYLDRLPDKPRVTKVQAAVAIDDVERMSLVYYVDPDDIQKHGLPEWLKGCNSIDGYHYQHRKLGITEMVQTEMVRQVPIGKVLDDHQVGRIKVLKIDTEGADCRILLAFFRHWVGSGKGRDGLPRRIVFENNGLTDALELERLLAFTGAVGYIRGQQSGDELTLYRS